MIDATLNGVPVVGFDGTVSPGVTPDSWTVRLTLPDFLDLDPQQFDPMTLVFSDDGIGDEVTFEDLYYIRSVEDEPLEADDAIEGAESTKTVLLYLVDRRYLWGFADAYTYEVNLLEDDGLTLDAGTTDPSTGSAWTFAGSIDHLVGRLPKPSTGVSTPLTDAPATLEKIAPPARWQITPTTSILLDVLGAATADLWLKPDAGVRLVDGKDALLPTFDDEQVHASDLASEDIPKPHYVRVYGGRKVFQLDDVALEAVAEDLDGSLVAIDDLTYAPAGGWEDSLRKKFGNVAVPVGAPTKADGSAYTAKDVQQRARQQVFRWWRIPDSFSVTVTGLGGDSEVLTITRDDQRLLAKIAEQELRTGTTGDRSKAAYMKAVYSYKKNGTGATAGSATGGALWETPDAAIPVPGSFDAQRGIFRSQHQLVTVPATALGKADFGDMTSTDIIVRAAPVGTFAVSGDPRSTSWYDQVYGMEYDVDAGSTAGISDERDASDRVLPIRDESLILRSIMGVDVEANKATLDAAALAMAEASVPDEAARTRGQVVLIGAWDYSADGNLTGAVKDVRYSLEEGEGGLSTTVVLNDTERPADPRKAARKVRDSRARAARRSAMQRNEFVAASVKASLGLVDKAAIGSDYLAALAAAGARASSDTPATSGAGPMALEGGDRDLLNRDHAGVVCLHDFASGGADFSGSRPEEIAFCRVKTREGDDDAHAHVKDQYGKLNPSVFYSALGEDEDVWFIRGYRLVEVVSGPTGGDEYVVKEITTDGGTRLTGTTVSGCKWIMKDMQDAIDTVYNRVADLFSTGTTATSLAVGDKCVMFCDHTGQRLLLGGTDVTAFPAHTVPTITGSRGGNAALTDLLTELDGIGFIVDSTTA